MILDHWDEEAKDTVRHFTYTEKERLNAIIAMHIMVCNMNDERAYNEWITLAVPDGANEWDFIQFAQNDDGTENNESFDEAVSLFKKLWRKYADKEKGLYIAKKTY